MGEGGNAGFQRAAGHRLDSGHTVAGLSSTHRKVRPRPASPTCAETLATCWPSSATPSSVVPARASRPDTDALTASSALEEDCQGGGSMLSTRPAAPCSVLAQQQQRTLRQLPGRRAAPNRRGAPAGPPPADPTAARAPPRLRRAPAASAPCRLQGQPAHSSITALPHSSSHSQDISRCMVGTLGGTHPSAGPASGARQRPASPAQPAATAAAPPLVRCGRRPVPPPPVPPCVCCHQGAG